MKKASYFRNLKSLSLSLFAFLALSMAFTSCSKDKSNNSLSVSLRVVNSAEASAPQDFYIDNTKANISAIAYGQNSTYFTTNSGNHQGQFKNTGTAATNATVNLSLAANQFYSVFYIDGSSTATYQDDRTKPQSGKARVRFINLSSAISSNVDLAVNGGTKLVSALAYKAASAYYDVDAATAFSLYASGSSSVLLNIPSAMSADHIYTIYISGATNATITSHVIAED